MMLKRDECTADDTAGTGQSYTAGWERWRGRQHKSAARAVNILCMARRAARRTASTVLGMVADCSQGTGDVASDTDDCKQGDNLYAYAAVTPYSAPARGVAVGVEIGRAHV
jgi:hypothetical protein